ncbi:MAG: Thiamin-phosphate pyrophosphorylase [Myxococcaceae bacterium]|nr:Thiamin-phosphate pyrophosphorylase [Myxococcaceae bacterium]
MKGLYAIIDPEHCDGRDPLWVAEQVLEGGCAALQLRSKSLLDDARLALARALSERCREHGVPFWMNDRVDLALLSGAAGVHLGQHDVAPADARRLFGGGSIGLSTHDPEQAKAAEWAGVDLIGFGPVFLTRSKQNPDPCVGLEGLRAVCRLVRCPVVAIGGIELAHASEIRASGAAYAAVISAVCMAREPRAAAHALHQALLG